VSRRELSEKAVSLRQNAAKRARLKRDGLSEFDSIIAGYRERLRELPFTSSRCSAAATSSKRRCTRSSRTEARYREARRPHPCAAPRARRRVRSPR
jgi:hypothetical protein